MPHGLSSRCSLNFLLARCVFKLPVYNVYRENKIQQNYEKYISALLKIYFSAKHNILNRNYSETKEILDKPVNDKIVLKTLHVSVG